MPWNLHVYLSGLFVVIPSANDAKVIETVFVNTGRGPDEHFCQMTLLGVVGRSDPVLPFDLDTHDIFLYDGTTLIKPAPPLLFRPLDGLPKLTAVSGLNAQPVPSVQRPNYPTTPYLWSARIGLYGGNISGENFTEETWGIHDYNVGKCVYGPRPISQTVLYEVPIQSKTATLEARSSIRSTWWSIGPKSPGGAAEVHITNLSSQSTRFKVGVVNPSSHFKLVFGLFKGKTNCDLVEGTPHPFLKTPSGKPSKIPKGAHVPCVGGCTIC